MFSQARELKAEVFASLPDDLRRVGEPSSWKFGKNNPDMHSFLEGPSIDHDGNIIVSDIPFGRLFRVSPKGEFAQIAEYDGEPNGLAIDRDGTVFMADHKNGLMKFDPRSNAITPVLTRLRREGFKGLNSVVFDADGNLYFTDQGQTGMQDPSGRVYRLNKDGYVELLVDTIPSPNAMAFSPDGRILYVAVTRANQIWRLPIHADGGTTKVNVFLHLSGGTTGPDGLAVDVEGNLVVCQCGLGVVWVFSRLGELLYQIRSPNGLDVTAACYGGPDNKTLFITESETGSILAVDMPVAGLKPYAHTEPK